MVLITIVMGVYKPTNITGRPLLVTKHKIHPKIRPENMSKISRGYLPTAVESPVKLVQKKTPNSPKWDDCDTVRSLPTSFSSGLCILVPIAHEHHSLP